MIPESIYRLAYAYRRAGVDYAELCYLIFTAELCGFEDRADAARVAIMWKYS
jgi:hypothetical protein